MKATAARRLGKEPPYGGYINNEIAEALNVKKLLLTLATLMTMLNVPAWGVSPDAVPEKKRTTLGLYLTAKEAHEVAQKEKVLFLDVRTRGEVVFLGTASNIDANIPYMDMSELSGWDDKKNTIQLEVNSDFMREFERRLAEKGLAGKGAKVVVMCRSGDRSAATVNFLAKAGYTNVWSVVDGYEGDMSKDGQRSLNGWKNSGLPWTYSLHKTKAYLPN